MTGRLGMLMASASELSFFLFSLSLVALSLSSLSLCLSFSLALNGLGLRNPIGLMVTDGSSVVDKTDVADCDTELTDDGLMEAEGRDDDPELNLLTPLNKLELPKNLELLPKDGVGWGAELAGVAIRVGLTLT